MCDCVEKMNKGLAPYNSRILIPIVGNQRPFVETEKIDEKKRGRAYRMFATFCPFCGEAYPENDNNLKSEIAEIQQ